MVDVVSVDVVAGPFVDFSYQFNLSREKVEKKIFSMLCEISKRHLMEKKSVGILVVVGDFGTSNNHQVDGMRSFGGKQIEKYMNVLFQQFEDDILKMFESGNDGAIVINQSGQVLGKGICLRVDNLSLDIPEGTGTRHISAASFSTREDVLATITLSEETLAVRLWKNGSFVEQFAPVEGEVE
jgi:DNA integrity scanning protein DisA with diadenylate cyclase activity